MKGSKKIQVTKLKSEKQNYFLGGYILGLKDYSDRPYISISMKSADSSGRGETVFIMIFKTAGFGVNKYANPLVDIIRKAKEQNIPIACVYYKGDNCNIMSACYANFTAEQRVGQSFDDVPPDNL